MTPISPSSTLTTTLAVLDRAQALTEQRDRVTQVLADLDPPYAPEVLTQAIEECLSEEGRFPEVQPPSHPYLFPWPRPKNEAERQQRRHQQRWGRFLETERGRSWLMFGSMLPAGAAWAGVGAGLGGPELALSMGLLMGLLTPIGIICGCDRWYRPSAQLREASGYLVFPEHVYLASPPARDYLRALLHSELPVLLQGDVEALNRLSLDAQVAHRQKQQRMAQEQAHQDQKDRAHRLQRLARALQAQDQITQDGTQA
jgi:hypothetical protein